MIITSACFHSEPKRVGNSSAESVQSFPVPRLPFAPKSYVCYRTSAPLVLEGKLDDEAWQRAAWTEDFVDIEGERKPAPRFRTRAKMLWDEKNFYIAAELEEPQVWATLTKRDAIIFYDNDFEVFIDPDGDTHRYYELEVNALATEWDLFLVKPYRDGGPPLHAWDIQGLQTRTHIAGTINHASDVDRGWSVEIALPWEVLKECSPSGAPPKEGQQWRVNFSRVEWQTEVIDGEYVKVKNAQTNKPLAEDNWVWSPQGLINMHYPEMWGFVQFSEKEVGSASDSVRVPVHEQAKWALRQLYYHQRTFFNQHGKFAENVFALGLPVMRVNGYRWPPEIKATWHLFEAQLPSTAGKAVWRINHEGLVWEGSELLPER